MEMRKMPGMRGEVEEQPARRRAVEWWVSDCHGAVE
jgi:hypothetical protein